MCQKNGVKFRNFCLFHLKKKVSALKIKEFFLIKLFKILESEKRNGQIRSADRKSGNIISTGAFRINWITETEDETGRITVNASGILSVSGNPFHVSCELCMDRTPLCNFPCSGKPLHICSGKPLQFFTALYTAFPFSVLHSSHISKLLCKLCKKLRVSE